MDPAKDSNIQDTMPFTLPHQQFILKNIRTLVI